MQRHRGGIGTTFGIVLTLVGIVLLIVLGVDLINRGSRWTMEKAFATSRAIDVANQAIDEVCRSPAHKTRIMEGLVDYLNTLYPGLGANTTPAGIEVAMTGLLSVVGRRGLDNKVADAFEGADPNERTVTSPDGMTLRLRPITGFNGVEYIYGHMTNTVAFGVDRPLRVVPSATQAAFADDPGLENVQGMIVELRPVLYGVSEPYTGIAGEAGPIGRGVVRARCGITYRMGRQSMTRWVTQDRFFSFIRTFDGTSSYTWSFEVSPSPWQVEAREKI